MADTTRCRVDSATLSCPLMTLDTVGWETAARAATSRIVARRPSSRLSE
jgi:hypothetical protein